MTARPHDDGTVLIDLAPSNDGFQKHLYVMEGWNYGLRLYRPRPQILDGTWTAPAPAPAS